MCLAATCCNNGDHVPMKTNRHEANVTLTLRGPRLMLLAAGVPSEEDHLCYNILVYYSRVGDSGIHKEP